jgi:catechol 2,3-dioxygenase-like lactoylglutathione lyase family enzyme
MMHHASIRTANIHRAIAFYEQLGFTVSDRFTAGITLACWMEGLGGRIELIQIPEPKPAPMPLGMSIMSGTTICPLTSPSDGN